MKTTFPNRWMGFKIEIGSGNAEFGIEGFSNLGIQEFWGLMGPGSGLPFERPWEWFLTAMFRPVGAVFNRDIK